jgi:hypothetical protein
MLYIKIRENPTIMKIQNPLQRGCSCGIVALYGLITNFFFLADHRLWSAKKTVALYGLITNFFSWQTIGCMVLLLILFSWQTIGYGLPRKTN